MTAALSEDEFQRMQEQLLELRQKNYTVGENNVKIKSELLQNNLIIENLRKELNRCQKIISRSKNAKEVEQLVQENDALQHKLQMQEDEFRLQNETLMKELTDLVSANDELTKHLELSKAQQLTSTFVENQNDIIKLEAENTALRKLLSNMENDGNSVSGNSNSRELELKLELETVLEEKLLLQNNISKKEKEFSEQILKMRKENEELSSKLKKKQESFLKLQEEKEQLYNENKVSLENLQETKESEILQLKREIYSIKSALQLSEDYNKEAVATVEIDGDKATFECSLNETKMSLINIQEKMQLLTKQLQESQDKVKSLEECNKSLENRIHDLEYQNSCLEAVVADKAELADNRKNLMDEMNNHLLETTNKHSTEIENLTRQLADEQEKLQKLYDKEKETEIKLVESRNEVQALNEEVERLRACRMDVNNKLKESVTKLEKTVSEYENKLSEKEQEYSDAMKSLKEEMESKLNDCIVQLEVAKTKCEEYEDQIKSLQQAAKDSIDERKIQEKKGVSMVKDLKRQLQVERNRAEKLQERLQEVLNEQNRSVDDILQTSSSDKPKGDASSISSWSYVSGGTIDKEHKENIQSDTSSGGHDSPNRVSPVLLESETKDLLATMTQLQQKNWVLEEKVNHLEMSNEALVDDVLKKTALIQFYCMEGRSDPHASVSQDKLTIKRIVDFIKDRGDENLKEMNRRMQRMLEETLTKNMHLQKDIETLSNEVSRLSKLVNSPIENGIQSAVFIDGV